MPSQQHRIANIERLRILAALCIVWYHTENAIGRPIGLAGLSIFLMVFCALTSRKPKPEDIAPFVKKKTQRLLKPWLFWSVIYAAYRLLKLSLYNIDFSDTFAGYMFLTGPSIHLWYLPFAFAAGLLVNLLQRWTIRLSSVVTILLTTVVGVLLLFSCWAIRSSFQIPVPITQWIFGLPAIPLGFAIGRVYSSLHSRMQRPFYFGILLATGSVCLLLAYFDYSQLVTQYGIAIVLVCAAFLWKGQCDPLSQRVASLTYGVYLIHPLVGAVLHHAGMSKANPWLLMVIVFLLSSVITLILQKTPFRQFV